jgi:cation:H+ antiporter
MALLLGVICAGAGGELFVRGAVGISIWARVSASIIGATVVAFCTSSPELSVAIGSALAGKPEISLGDAVGSNVVNVALILALALCISSIRIPRSSIRRDYSVALFVPVLLGVLGLDGVISRLEGGLLLALFTAWFLAVTLAARRERSACGALPGKVNPTLAGLELVTGLGFLVGSGHMIVAGARGIAATFGIPDFIIGASVVALGTSAPEFATTIISKLRRHDEIALGGILGSNIFNGLLIVGTAAIICPIRVEQGQVAVALIAGLAATLLTFPSASGILGRHRGVILLLIYLIYLAAMIAR